MKQGMLEQRVGSASEAIAGGEAGANTAMIEALPTEQRDIIRAALADSLQPMWIMYTAFAAAGLVCCLLIKRTELTKEHQITETGLGAQEKARQQREAEKEAKDTKKGNKSQV